MKYKVSLNNKIYEVEVEKGEAVLVDEYEAAAPVAAAPAAPAVVAAAPVAAAPAAPVAAAPAGTGTAVKAPMPGNVTKILVTDGQKVKEGDTVIVIEAMKMENEVCAPVSGTVNGIAVSRTQAVETGTALLYIS